MFRTLRMRLVVTYMAILLSTLILLGSAFMGMYRQEFLSRSTKAVQNEAKELATLVRPNMFDGADDRFISSRIEYFARREDAVIWVVDIYGNVAETGPSGQTVHFSLTQDEMNRYFLEVIEGDLRVFSGHFGGRFEASALTVAEPVISDGITLGAVFIHVDIAGLEDSLQAMIRQLWLSGYISIFLGVALILLMAARITKPLNEITAAAKRVALGDYSQRVSVESSDELGEMATTFNQMQIALASMDSVQKDLVANVSHELRTPLTSIQGFIQGMRDGVIPQQKHQEYMDLVLSECRRLTKLISDLLDLSRIDAGNDELRKEMFDVSELLRRVIIKRQVILEEAKMQVNTRFPDEAAMVYADPERMEQVFTNLIDNAIKYSGDGGEIRVFVTPERHRHQMLVTVADDGMGIEPEKLPHVFDRFYKADTAHTSGTGFGLGLAIVKKILDNHGAEICVWSEMGEGTTFAVRLSTLRDKPARTARGEKANPKNEPEETGKE